MGAALKELDHKDTKTQSHKVIRDTKETASTNHAPLSDEEERIAQAIVASAFAVHSNLGPGLLENVYEVCFCHELAKRGLSYRRQVVVPIVYDGITFDEGQRLDVLVEDRFDQL